MITSLTEFLRDRLLVLLLLLFTTSQVCPTTEKPARLLIQAITAHCNHAPALTHKLASTDHCSRPSPKISHTAVEIMLFADQSSASVMLKMYCTQSLSKTITFDEPKTTVTAFITDLSQMATLATCQQWALSGAVMGVSTMSTSKELE